RAGEIATIGAFRRVVASVCAVGGVQRIEAVDQHIAAQGYRLFGQDSAAKSVGMTGSRVDDAGVIQGIVRQLIEYKTRRAAGDGIYRADNSSIGGRRVYLLGEQVSGWKIGEANLVVAVQRHLAIGNGE